MLLSTVLISNDAIVLGILLLMLAFVFTTSHSETPFWKRFYTFVPALVLCYFLPALPNFFLGLFDEGLKLYDPEASKLYNPVASRFLLPASLVLLCINIDIKGLIGLGPKSLIMFLTATVGIVLGGPIALFIIASIDPSVLNIEGPDQLWAGLTTVAGSWIGGGANQAAMKEINEVSEKLFSSMVVIDVVVANIWMAFLLIGANKKEQVDRWLKADSSAIDELKDKVEAYSAKIAKIPTTTDVFQLLAVGFGATALSHFGASLITPLLDPYAETLQRIGLSSLNSSFFWLIVLATTFGLILSFTKARNLEGAGASRVASVFIYILVATIGMKMDILEVLRNWKPFFIGIIWMMVHVGLLLFVAKKIRAPYFFVAVGSQANIGGAASAPVVASAFSPALAPVGAIMAVLGYALGTYGAILCGILMQAVEASLT